MSDKKVEQPQVASPETKLDNEAGDKKQNNLWMNRIPASFFSHDKDTGDLRVIKGHKTVDGQTVETERVPLNLRDEKGPFSVLIDRKFVMPEVNQKGEPMANMMRIRGFEGLNLNVSRVQMGEDGKPALDADGKRQFERSSMKFEELKAGYDARQREFWAKQREARAADKGMDAPAAPEAGAELG